MSQIHTFLKSGTRRSLSFCALLSLVACVFASNAAQTGSSKLDGIKRIVVLGDSITQAGDYLVDLDCWLLVQGRHVEMINLGLGSETVSDLTAAENEGHLKRYGFGRPFLSERLKRALEVTKPDIVIACYGMNDGGALPPNEEGTKRFAEAVTKLREASLQAGVRRVVLLTPPVKETKEGSWSSNVHDQSLARYTTWLLSRRADGWDVVDIHTPMRQALEQKRTKDSSFGFSKDEVHPGREGHWLMASCVITQSFGADLQGVNSAEQLFPKHGPEIRALVRERLNVRFAAWMTRIGHLRPGVPGGPKAQPGPSLAEAETKARALSRQIDELLPSRG